MEKQIAKQILGNWTFRLGIFAWELLLQDLRLGNRAPLAGGTGWRDPGEPGGAVTFACPLRNCQSLDWVQKTKTFESLVEFLTFLNTRHGCMGQFCCLGRWGGVRSPESKCNWALVSEPGFLKFQIFRFSIL